jgi:hypothetical protein
MDDERDNLPEDCQRAAEVQVRLLADEDVTPDEREFLASHTAACADCATLASDLARTDAAVQTAFVSARAGDSFAARTMERLAASAEQRAGSAARVLAVARPSAWRWVNRAAAVAAGVLLAVALAAWLGGGAGWLGRDAVAVSKGLVTDSLGNAVRRLKVGEIYKVKETAVVPLSNSSVLKVQAGTEFQVKGLNGDGPAVAVQKGDLYARGKDGQKATRVSAAVFNAALHQGDFFVAGDDAAEPAGVVIVFAGQADVAFQEQTVPLRDGEVFVSVGAGEDAVGYPIELLEMIARLAEHAAAGEPDVTAARRDYQRVVEGYKSELKALQGQVKGEQDARRRAELKDRYERVQRYRDAHQRRLDGLRQAAPLDMVRRGLEGHVSDPSTWL